MRVLIIALIASFAGVAGAKDVNRVVLHLSEADPARQNLVLNNASNINRFYQEKGKEVEIEIVTYGPGLTMLIPGRSSVVKRVESISQNHGNVSFRACANTHAKMSEKVGKDIKLMSQVTTVPSGVVHLVQRQQQGWIYIRP